MVVAAVIPAGAGAVALVGVVGEATTAVAEVVTFPVAAILAAVGAIPVAAAIPAAVVDIAAVLHAAPTAGVYPGAVTAVDIGAGTAVDHAVGIARGIALATVVADGDIPVVALDITAAAIAADTTVAVVMDMVVEAMDTQVGVAAMAAAGAAITAGITD